MSWKVICLYSALDWYQRGRLIKPERRPKHDEGGICIYQDSDTLEDIETAGEYLQALCDGTSATIDDTTMRQAEREFQARFFPEDCPTP